jgi:hypothetical protein
MGVPREARPTNSNARLGVTVLADIAQLVNEIEE